RLRTCPAQRGTPARRTRAAGLCAAGSRGRLHEFSCIMVPNRKAMLQENIEAPWLAAFEAVLSRCALRPGDTVAVLSESQSRAVLPQLARLAAARLRSQVFAIAMPTLPEPGPAVRSTGASTSLQ